MKIKCPRCGNENYFSGLEDEESRFCSDCNKPLFKIRKDFKQDYLFKIFKNSTMAVEVIRRLVEKKGTNQNKYNLNDAEWSLILFEFIYFYLHLTDRFAFGHMNDEQREILMIDLGELCITAAVDAVFLKWPEDKKEKNKEEYMGNFNISVAEYSKYKKWLPEKDEGAKGTLLWEFGKTIAKLARQEHAVIFKLTVAQTVTNSLKDLDIKSFIKRVKEI